MSVDISLSVLSRTFVTLAEEQRVRIEQEVHANLIVGAGASSAGMLITITSMM